MSIRNSGAKGPYTGETGGGGGGGGVEAVSARLPLFSTGGAAPQIQFRGLTGFGAGGSVLATSADGTEGAWIASTGDGDNVRAIAPTLSGSVRIEAAASAGEHVALTLALASGFGETQLRQFYDATAPHAFGTRVYVGDARVVELSREESTDLTSAVFSVDRVGFYESLGAEKNSVEAWTPTSIPNIFTDYDGFASMMSNLFTNYQTLQKALGDADENGVGLIGLT